SIQWVDAIQDKVFFSALSGGFHRHRHSGRVGIETAADILDVKDQGIQVFELLRRWFLSLTVQAIDGQPAFLIHTIAHLLILDATNAVLRTEKDVELNVRRVLQKIYCWI